MIFGYKIYQLTTSIIPFIMSIIEDRFSIVQFLKKAKVGQNERKTEAFAFDSPLFTIRAQIKFAFYKIFVELKISYDQKMQKIQYWICYQNACFIKFCNFFILNTFHNLTGIIPSMIYEFWMGHQRFCFQGRCIMGPSADWPMVLVYYILLVGIFSCYLWLYITYQYKIPKELAYITFFSILTSYILYLLTAYTDPGIIPPKKFKKYVFQRNSQTQVGNKSKSNSYSSKQVRAYCDDCDIEQRERSGHCSICNTCTEVRNHHCVIVNNCVGKRNYRYYFMFLLMSCLSLALVIAGLTILIANDKVKDVTKIGIGMIVALCGVFFLIFMVFIMINIILLCKKTTQRESQKGIVNNGEEGFDWCKTSTPLVNFRTIIVDDSRLKYDSVAVIKENEDGNDEQKKEDVDFSNINIQKEKRVFWRY